MRGRGGKANGLTITGAERDRQRDFRAAGNAEPGLGSRGQAGTPNDKSATVQCEGRRLLCTPVPGSRQAAAAPSVRMNVSIVTALHRRLMPPGEIPPAFHECYYTIQDKTTLVFQGIDLKSL